MDKILNNLGLCMRAGQLVVGENLVIDGIRKGEICYVFLANDCGQNTNKQVRDKAKFYNVEICDSYNSLELSNAVGKNNKKVLGVKKSGSNFLKILRK